MPKLNALKLRALKPGTHSDGGGLYCRVRYVTKLVDGQEETEVQRNWLFRYSRGGKAHWMGLGVAGDIGLAEARDAAQAARKALRANTDPIDQRRTERAEAASRAGLNTFKEVAEAYIRAHERGWKNEKHVQQWKNTLDQYAYPVMGKAGVAMVGTGDVMRVLEPLWLDRTETASRLRGRIEAVLDYAGARGWRTGDNPARWRGHLDNLLPARAKVARVEHHAALPWREVGAFMATLAQQEGVSAWALRFAILTAARTGEVIGARWNEIDVDQAIWTVPAERMKAGREHRVPLADGALDVLREMAKLRTAPMEDGYVFPGGKTGKPLSSMALLMTLRRMDRGDLTVHGFRSTFRDWCAEATNYPRETAEAALAHTLKDKVEAAYQRADLLEKRRRLMADWATFCARPMAATAADVIQLREAVA